MVKDVRLGFRCLVGLVLLVGCFGPSPLVWAGILFVLEWVGSLLTIGFFLGFSP